MSQTETLAELRCGKCGGRLWVLADDVHSYREPYPDTPMGYTVAIGLDGEPMTCPRHGSSTYFLQPASRGTVWLPQNATRRPEIARRREIPAAGQAVVPVGWGPIDMGNRFNELLERWWRRASAEGVTPHARPDYADATERCANELYQAYEDAFSAARREGLENATRPPEVTRDRATSAAGQATADKE